MLYDELSDGNEHVIDSSCSGPLFKNENDTWQLYGMLVENSLQHTSSSSISILGPVSNKNGVLELI